MSYLLNVCFAVSPSDKRLELGLPTLRLLFQDKVCHCMVGQVNAEAVQASKYMRSTILLPGLGDFKLQQIHKCLTRVESFSTRFNLPTYLPNQSFGRLLAGHKPAGHAWLLPKIVCRGLG